MITNMNKDNEYFKEFQEDVNAAWSKRLFQEFDVQNVLVHKHLHVYLQPPNFSFSFEKGYWGKWHPDTKIIDFNYFLLHNYEWNAVVHTMKHEMAHMIVTEIWKDVSDNGNDHGELFKKACVIMNVDPSKGHNGDEKAEFKLSEKEEVVSKIYKLFCLGESNHKAEAEAAISKAQELMVKYNISMLDLPQEKKIFVFRPIGNIYDKVPNYVKVLARLVNAHYFVQYIYITYGYSNRGYRRKKRRYVEIYGEPHNVDIAEYVYHFLLWEGERQWKEFQKSEEYQKRFDDDYGYGDMGNNRRRGKYSKVAFLEGLYSGFENTLSEREQKVMEKVDPTNTLPIGTNDKLLKEKYEEHYHPVNWHSSSYNGIGGGFGEGRKVGEGLKIRQGVASGVKGGRMLIGA